MNNPSKTIEVELRGLMTAEQSATLAERLTAQGITREADDKDTYFFNVRSGVLKVCDDKAKGRAKLSLKIGDETTGAMEEREVTVEPSQVPAFVDFIAALGYGAPHLVQQQRTNWFLGEATLSLKFTADFQHHFELEGRLLADEAEVPAERTKLEALCHELGLTPLTAEEIAERVAAIRDRLGFN